MKQDAPLTFVWLDLEMTGLIPEKDRILEIATLVTDAQLNVLAEGPSLVIHQDDQTLAGMNSWCVEQHGASGLTEAVQASTVTEAMAEQETLAFLKQYTKAGIAPLCGNSIGQDRAFLRVWMPELADFFHYRNLDVSTVKILTSQWYPKLALPKKLDSKHRAMDDIYDSVHELAYYRQHIFNAD